jgi:hypothetical protein
MRLATRILMFVVALLFCAGATGWGQQLQTARVTGTVADTSGAIIPGAQVQITGTQTGLVRKITSGADGAFVLPDLPIGLYELQVTKQGFATYEQPGIQLEVGATPTIDVVLKAGSEETTIVVSANATVIETHSNSIGQVVNQQTVVDMPLNGRDPMQLLTLTPGAQNIASGLTPGVAAGFNGPTMVPNPIQVSFAGTNPGEGTYYLDGSNDNNAHFNGSYPLPFPDSLAEFKVDTSAVPAQYGMHAAASINVATKSGTNEFHGDAFEFVRNYIFDARNFFTPVATGRDKLKRNQFGGVIGGPIKKDKLFFFAAIQDEIQRDSTTTSTFVPTAAEEAGNFQAVTSSPCVSSPITLGAPFVNNMIPSGDISQPALNLAKHLPLSTTDPNCGSLSVTTKNDPDQQWIIGKVDYHFSDKNSFFFRYYFVRYNLPFDTTTWLTQNTASQYDRYHNPAAGWTYLISSSMVNSVHAAVNRAVADHGEPPTQLSPGQLGVAGYYPVNGYINLGLGGGQWNVKYGTGVTPTSFNNTDFQVSDDLEITKGAHQLGFGANWVHFNDDNTSPVYANAEFYFGGTNTAIGAVTGASAEADFILGEASYLEKGNLVDFHKRKNYIGVYAQDSWQVTRKLTVNYGVRWEPYFPDYSNDNEGNFFSTSNFQNDIVSQRFKQAPPGMEYPPADYPGKGNNTLLQKWHFEPRVGLSYDPRGKGREVIRAAYGMFYDFESQGFWQQTVQGPPWGDAFVNSVGENFANPFGPCLSYQVNCGYGPSGYTYNGVSGVDPYPISASGYVFPTGGLYAVARELNMRTPNLQSWNLSVEKQLWQNFSVTLSYMGNKGTHNWLDNELNPAEYLNSSNDGGNAALNCSITGTGGVSCPNAAARRYLNVIYTQQHPTIGLNSASNLGNLYGGPIDEGMDVGTSSYNGGILTLNKRFSHGFQVIGNYTYSHCLDNGDAGGGIGADAYLGNLKSAVGPCGYDRRQLISITAVARSPHYTSGIGRRIISDWQVSPIINYESHDWVTITTGTDTASMGMQTVTGQRACYIGGSIATPHKEIVPSGNGRSGPYYETWFNSAVFKNPGASTVCTPAGFTGNVINAGNGPITVGPLGNLARGTVPGASNTEFDLAIVRDFRLNERNAIELRFESFNVLNLVNFSDPVTSLSSSATFGDSTAAGTPRQLQLAAKWTF